MLQKWKTEDTQLKAVFYIMVLVLLAVLLPLFMISHYNFTSVDDYTFAQEAQEIWEQSHSVVAVFIGQISNVIDIYFEWQGTFFGEWIATSLMGIFTKNAYYVGTYLALGGFVAAELFAFMVILGKVLGADKYRAGIIGISCICLQVLLTPSPVEAYFWFCGAILYTFIHGLALLLLTLIVLLYWHSGKKGGKIALTVGIGLLSFAIGGSNYITALTMLLVYGMATIYFFWKKHTARISMAVNGVIFLVSFLINVLAPGNVVRQTSSGMDHLPVMTSILAAFKEAINYIGVYTMLPCVIVGIMLIPIISAMVNRKSYRYPLPGMVSLISFCLFAAQFAPTIFALGITGAGRVQNIYRFNLYLFLLINEIYWIGWSQRRKAADTEPQKTSFLLPGFMAGGVMLLIALYLWGGTTITSYSAFRSLRDGSAQRYYEEYQERLVILEDESQKNVELKPFSAPPYLLYFGDIVSDPGDWVNQSVAQYYGKESVQLSE